MTLIITVWKNLRFRYSKNINFTKIQFLKLKIKNVGMKSYKVERHFKFEKSEKGGIEVGNVLGV